MLNPLQEPSQSSSNESSSDEEIAVAESGGENKYGIHSVCLIISAIPVESAYSCPDQNGPFQGYFVTRHSASCEFIMADESAIPFLGYLPQVRIF